MENNEKQIQGKRIKNEERKLELLTLFQLYSKFDEKFWRDHRPDKEMDQEQTEFFMRLTLMKDTKEFGEKEEFFLKQINESPIIQILEKRKTAYNLPKLKFDWKVRAFMTGSGVINTSGEVMIYLWYICTKLKQHDKCIVDWDFFGKNCFPHGFFSSETTRKIWDSQKGSNHPELFEAGIVVSNLVDVSALWNCFDNLK